MEWITVIGLILFGIGLLIIEVIFIPGTTIVGIAGFICSGFGVYLGYDYFDSTTGTTILIVSSSFLLVVMIYAFKSRAWERFSLKDENTGRFNDDFKVTLSVGDQGQTISSLKPSGKALFNEKELEVRSNGGFINENQQIKIIRIEPNKIIVEPIN
ncbi:NfeD family protein [Marinoscillum luteum]|uniref:NfeD family protein n=1 Tax=Marinoscillum luteum TaxID=861051 RepID=A0ABW7NA72_9BACT